MRAHAASAYGAHACNVPDEELQGQMEELLNEEGVWTQRHGQTLALTSLLKHLHRNGRNEAAAAAVVKVLDKLKRLVKDDRVPVREAVAAASGNALRILLEVGGQEQSLSALWKVLGALVADRAAEVKVEALKAVKLVAKSAEREKIEDQVDPRPSQPFFLRAPEILHPAPIPSTLYLKPCTLHPKPSTLYPKPST